MTDSHHLKLKQFLNKPDFYPHPAEDLACVETHISMVFLAGERVYKIKKPVSMDFLDFSELEQRRLCCLDEVRLNRRLTDGVYKGVVAITESEDQLFLEGEGQPVEYAVKMKRLEDQYTLGKMLSRKALASSDLENLAARLADFFHQAPAVKDTGGWDTVHQNCEENFEQMKPFVQDPITPTRFDYIQAATRGFLEARRTVFRRRLENGNIKEGHGDLRLEHIYFTPEGIQIIDCIEFNKRMRCGDVAADIAFLMMDLDNNDFTEAAEQFLFQFMMLHKDPQLFALLDFYLCYRACVRLKVTCFRLGQKELEKSLRNKLLDRVQKFTLLAHNYARRFARPTIYIFMGMIASGKSTLASAFSKALDVETLSTDHIRKKIFAEQSKTGASGDFGKGIYKPEARSLVYGRMLLAAQERIHDNLPIILDATFGGKEQRMEALRLAEESDADIVFIECQCPENVIRHRLEERENTDTESDARLSLLEDFKANYQPPQKIPDRILIKADTTQPVEKLVIQLFIASRRIYDFRLLPEGSG